MVYCSVLGSSHCQFVYFLAGSSNLLPSGSVTPRYTSLLGELTIRIIGWFCPALRVNASTWLGWMLPCSTAAVVPLAKTIFTACGVAVALGVGLTVGAAVAVAGS